MVVGLFFFFFDKTIIIYVYRRINIRVVYTCNGDNTVGPNSFIIIVSVRRAVLEKTKEIKENVRGTRDIIRASADD